MFFIKKKDLMNFGKSSEYKYNIWAFSHFSDIHVKAAEKNFFLSYKSKRNKKFENKLNLFVNSKLNLFFKLKKKLLNTKSNSQFMNDSVYISSVKNFYNDYHLKKEKFLKDFKKVQIKS